MGRRKGSSKYSPELVEALKMALGSGLTCTQAGEQFGLNYQAVRYATRDREDHRPIAGDLLDRTKEDRSNGLTLMEIAKRYHKSEADVGCALQGVPRGERTVQSDLTRPKIMDNPPLDDGGCFLVRVYRGKEVAGEARYALYPNYHDMMELFGNAGIHAADFQNRDGTKARVQRGYGYGQGGARIPFTIERLRDEPLCAADFVR